jgi:hypothetical protein
MADIFKIQYSNILYSLSVLRYHLRSDSVYGGYHFNAKPAVSRTCFRIDLVSCKLKVLHKNALVEIPQNTMSKIRNDFPLH